jgi:hypothetical protein
MEHLGSFDAYILNQKNEKLSNRALTVKKKIQAQLRKKTAKAAKPVKKTAK